MNDLANDLAMVNQRNADEIFNMLCAPFPVELIEWRVGPTNAKHKKPDDPPRGQPLCYVDARTVMDRLDSVCGFDGWQCNYTPGVGTSIACNIGILIAGDWLWKADGAGATDMEAEKGTFSDAFKRAAVRWGVARYLYDIHSPWITLEMRGTSPFIPDSARPGLDKLHDDFARRAGWGAAEGTAAYRLLLADLKMLPPVSRKSFAQTHAPLIDRLPVAMRKHLLGQIENGEA